jgi:hypothetical protein
MQHVENITFYKYRPAGGILHAGFHTDPDVDLNF